MSMLLAESYFHTLDPVAIPLWGTISVKWYGLAYAAGFLIAWLFIRWMAKTKRTPLTVVAAGDLMFYIILGVLLGGRLGYAVFYKPSLFITFEDHMPFWGLLAINEGGMASHGGMIGVIIAVVLFARRQRVSALHVLDLAALACTPGLMLGRLANFVNGELWGRALPAAMQASPPWWSVKYPEEIALPEFQQNTERVAQLAQNLSSIPGGAMMSDPEKIWAARHGNTEVIDAMRPVLTAYYPSQIFQALTDGPILGLILALVWIRPRKPGTIGATFLLSYGVLRVATEYFRQPDAGVALLLGFSRGQVLSLLMIVAGLVGLAIVRKRNVEPLGGWAGQVTGGGKKVAGDG